MKMKYIYDCLYEPFAISWNPHLHSLASGAESVQVAFASGIEINDNIDQHEIQILSLDMHELNAWEDEASRANHHVNDEDTNHTLINESRPPVQEATKIRCQDYISRLQWSPSNRQILASCGRSLNLWRIEDNKINLLQCLINKKSIENPPPLTSFDWNPVDPNIIGTSSIDTTCTIWNLENAQVKTQLIAHDKPVFDITFTNSVDLFGSCSRDGSVRLFDLRNLDHSTILFESPSQEPLLKVTWNKLDDRYLLTFGLNDQDITLLDRRKPSIPLSMLVGHNDKINDVTWAPHLAQYACSVADNGQIMIWNLTDPSPVNAMQINPLYVCDLIDSGHGNQISWIYDWLAVSARSSIQWFKI